MIRVRDGSVFVHILSTPHLELIFISFYILIKLRIQLNLKILEYTIKSIH